MLSAPRVTHLSVNAQSCLRVPGQAGDEPAQRISVTFSFGRQSRTPFSVSTSGRSINIGWRTIASSMSRSEEHTCELQSLMRTSSAVFCLKKKQKSTYNITPHNATDPQRH